LDLNMRQPTLNEVQPYGSTIPAISSSTRRFGAWWPVLYQHAAPSECERNATLVAAARGAEGNGGKRITAKSANWEPYERSWNGTNGNAESIRENEAFPYLREENAAGARADPRMSEQQPATRGRAWERERERERMDEEEQAGVEDPASQ
jgi:hypothetical protein